MSIGTTDGRTGTPTGLGWETAKRRNSISIPTPAPNEALMGFVLFALLAVDASVYLAVAGPTLLALGASAVASTRPGTSEPENRP